MATASSQASLLLSKQLRGADPPAPSKLSIDLGALILLLFDADLAKHPVDGFSAGLVDDSNVFEWQVTIIGPPETL
jgi:ubiquitin-conjugating enzyme E2 G1